MSVTIHIPTALRAFTGGQAEIGVEAATVGEALSAVIALHPALRPHLYSGKGGLRNFVSVFLNDHDVRTLDGEATSVRPGDTLLIIPSIAGGRA